MNCPPLESFEQVLKKFVLVEPSLFKVTASPEELEETIGVNSFSEAFPTAKLSPVKTGPTIPTTPSPTNLL